MNTTRTRTDEPDMEEIAANLEQLWDSVYFGARTAGIWDVNPDPFLVDFLNNHPLSAGSRALDLGCGDGRNLVWLARQGLDSCGVDISGLALDRARELAVEADVTFSVTKGLLEDLPFDGDSFDFVFASQVLDHVPEPEAILVEAHRVLAPGGTVLCQLSTTEDDASRCWERLGPNLRRHNGILFRFFERKHVDDLFGRFSNLEVHQIELNDPPHEGWRDEPHVHSYWIVSAND